MKLLNNPYKQYRTIEYTQCLMFVNENCPFKWFLFCVDIRPNFVVACHIYLIWSSWS
uniref:Uncharacterized protein n=1 Tax=Lepeophtheirus salmonis TaxID=72036 RepID=A0A0K2U562_LEPSM